MPARLLVQRKLYGVSVFSASLAPLAKNSTFTTTPSGSLAVASKRMFVGKRKNAPFVGVRSETSGGSFTTVIVTGDEVTIPRRLSVARAVKVCEPTEALLQTTLKGGLE